MKIGSLYDERLMKIFQDIITLIFIITIYIKWFYDTDGIQALLQCQWYQESF